MTLDFLCFSLVFCVAFAYFVVYILFGFDCGCFCCVDLLCCFTMLLAHLFACLVGFDFGSVISML